MYKNKNSDKNSKKIERFQPKSIRTVCQLGWNCPKLMANKCTLTHDPQDKLNIQSLNRIKGKEIIIIADTFYKEVKPVCLFEPFLPIQLINDAKINIQIGKYFIGHFVQKKDMFAIIRIQKLLGSFGSWNTQSKLINDYWRQQFDECEQIVNQNFKKGQIKVNRALQKVLIGERGAKHYFKQVNTLERYPLLHGSKVQYFEHNNRIKFTKIIQPQWMKLSGILQLDSKSQFYVMSRNQIYDDMNPYIIPRQIEDRLKDKIHILPYTMLKKQKINQQDRQKINNFLQNYIVKGQFRGWPLNSRFPIIQLIEQVEQKNFKSQKNSIIYEAGIAMRPYSQAQKKECQKQVKKFRIQNYKKRSQIQGSIFTVDNKQTKCHDDAIFIKKSENKQFKVELHIADVEQFVKKDSPLNKAIKQRDSTLYLKNYYQPMIPDTLRNLLSLSEGSPKLAFTLQFKITENGHINFQSIRFLKSVIEVQKNLAYERLERGTQIYPQLFDINKLLQKSQLIQANYILQCDSQNQVAMARLIHLSSMIPTVMLQLNIERSTQFEQQFEQFIKKVIEQKRNDMQKWQQQIMKINKIKKQQAVHSKDQKQLQNLIKKQITKQKQRIMKQLKQSEQVIRKQKKQRQQKIKKPKNIQELSDQASTISDDQTLYNENLLQNDVNGRINVDFIQQIDDQKQIKLKAKRAKVIKQIKNLQVSEDSEYSSEDQGEVIKENTDVYKKNNAFGSQKYLQRLFAPFNFNIQWRQIKQINRIFAKIMSLDSGKLYQQYFKKAQITNRQYFSYIVNLQKQKRGQKPRQNIRQSINQQEIKQENRFRKRNRTRLTQKQNTNKYKNKQQEQINNILQSKINKNQESLQQQNQQELNNLKVDDRKQTQKHQQSTKVEFKEIVKVKEIIKVRETKIKKKYHEINKVQNPSNIQKKDHQIVRKQNNKIQKLIQQKQLQIQEVQTQQNIQIISKAQQIKLINKDRLMKISRMIELFNRKNKRTNKQSLTQSQQQKLISMLQRQILNKQKLYTNYRQIGIKKVQIKYSLFEIQNLQQQNIDYHRLYQKIKRRIIIEIVNEMRNSNNKLLVCQKDYKNQRQQIKKQQVLSIHNIQKELHTSKKIYEQNQQDEFKMQIQSMESTSKTQNNIKRQKNKRKQQTRQTQIDKQELNSNKFSQSSQKQLQELNKQLLELKHISLDAYQRQIHRFVNTFNNKNSYYKIRQPQMLRIQLMVKMLIQDKEKIYQDYKMINNQKVTIFFSQLEIKNIHSENSSFKAVYKKIKRSIVSSIVKYFGKTKQNNLKSLNDQKNIKICNQSTKIKKNKKQIQQSSEQQQQQNQQQNQQRKQQKIFIKQIHSSMKIQKDFEKQLTNFQLVNQQNSTEILIIKQAKKTQQNRLQKCQTSQKHQISQNSEKLGRIQIIQKSQILQKQVIIPKAIKSSKNSKRQLTRKVEQLSKPLINEIKQKYKLKQQQLKQKVQQTKLQFEQISKTLKEDLTKSQVHFNLIRLLALQQEQIQENTDINKKGKKKNKNKKKNKDKQNKKQNVYSDFLQNFYTYADKAGYKFKIYSDQQIDDFLSKQLKLKQICDNSESSLSKINQKAKQICSKQQNLLKWNNPIRSYESLRIMRLIKSYDWLFQSQIYPTQIIRYFSDIKAIKRQLKQLREYRQIKAQMGQKSSKAKQANRQISKLQFYYLVKKDPTAIHKFLNITSATAKVKMVFHPILGDLQIDNIQFIQDLYKQVKGKVIIIRDFPIKFKIQLIK